MVPSQVRPAQHQHLQVCYNNPHLLSHRTSKRRFLHEAVHQHILMVPLEVILLQATLVAHHPQSQGADTTRHLRVLDNLPDIVHHLVPGSHTDQGRTRNLHLTGLRLPKLYHIRNCRMPSSRPLARLLRCFLRLLLRCRKSKRWVCPRDHANFRG